MAREGTATAVLEWDGVVGGPQCPRGLGICVTDTQPRLPEPEQLAEPPSFSVWHQRASVTPQGREALWCGHVTLGLWS